MEMKQRSPRKKSAPAFIPVQLDRFLFCAIREVKTPAFFSFRSINFLVFAILFVLSLLIPFSTASLFSSPALERVEDVPNPLATTGKSVGDGAGVLGPAYIDLIDGVCKQVKQTTGAEIAVITVRSLGGTDIEEFAVRLFERFGVGEKGKDNGLLILLAMEDRNVRIEVGYGLESAITDAQTARLLDDHAVPFLARGEYGRGLYAVAKAAAEKISGASGASLAITDPPVWPEQLQPPPASSSKSGAAASSGAGKQGASSQRSFDLSLIFAGIVLGTFGLWAISALSRFRKAKAKAARARLAASGKGLQALVVIGSVPALIALLASGRGILSLLAFIAAPTASSFLWPALRRSLKQRAESYRLTCNSCGSPMDLVPEDQDDAELSVEEAAEEKAGGMDYEVWRCSNCGAGERLSVELPKAGPCPQCKRRTLVRSITTLAAATTSHGGRQSIIDACRNPKCGYSKTWERTTPRIATTSSSSSSRSGGFGSSSSSSRSSFGGGRSGGGGASRRF